MIDLPYSLVIEATEDPNFFCFYSDELDIFTGVGYSIEDCIKKAKIGMEEHLKVLKEFNKTIPPKSKNPAILIFNEEKELVEAQ